MGLKEVFLIVTAMVAIMTAQEGDNCPHLCTCVDSYGEMTVTCGGQGLTEVPTNIPTNTVWLILKYNNLVKIGSHDFKGLKQLKGINLSNNRIRKISRGALRHLVHLDNIDLSGNKLRTLSEETFTVPLTAAKQEDRRFFVYLAYNPWLCDCNLKWLAEQYANGSTVYSDRLVHCDAPDKLNGTFLSDVPLDKFKCGEEVTFVDSEPEDDTNTPQNTPRVEKGTPKHMSVETKITIVGVLLAVVLVVFVMFKIGKECQAGREDTDTAIESKPMIPRTDNTISREVYM